MINPYYNPEKLNLEMIDFMKEFSHSGYNCLCFWANSAGCVYIAQDEGCSWPPPFSEYEGKIQSEVICKMERVESLKHAQKIYNDWNDNYFGNEADVKLRKFIKKHLKNWG